MLWKNFPGKDGSAALEKIGPYAYETDRQTEFIHSSIRSTVLTECSVIG